MESLNGRVAVITGGAGGIGLAMGERFAAEGMKVVLADIQPDPLERAAAELRSRGHDVIGVPADVSSLDSVIALRDAALAEFGAVHLLCNNAGIAAGAEGPMWEHEASDWRWAVGVNLYGVVHGISAFVPGMIASGEEGHVVNTSSPNGGLWVIPSTPQYAATKAAVVTVTECLYAQLRDAGAPIGASVLFPGPHVLRTGLFESWRTRPAELARERPRTRPYTTADDIEAAMRAAGAEPRFTDVSEVAGQVVDAVLAGRFWIHPEHPPGEARQAARLASMRERRNPDYLAPTPP